MKPFEPGWKCLPFFLHLAYITRASTPSDVRQCLVDAVGGNHHDVAFPDQAFYQLKDVQRWNLDLHVTPAAVTYPESADQISAIIKCAAQSQLKVQAKGGGHSFGNYGLGGNDGAVVVDLKHFQQFSIDTTAWQATIGAGTHLKDVTKKLHKAGGRAISHGTCPAVGIGGHATIGGLGPTSRQFGSTLDHVEEVTVVLANSTITTASRTHNSDLFFALKGAGASFGVITEFKVRTEPEPGEIVQFSFSFSHGSYASMADTFKDWQEMISDPLLPRKFSSEVIVTQLGLIISGTYFGPKSEYDSLDIATRFFHHGSANVVVFKDWLGWVGHLADDAALLLGTGNPTPIFCKSLAFKNTTLIPADVIDTLFTYFDNTEKGTPLWFAYFDLEGGAVNDVPMDATAYAHRDALFYMQSYAVGLHFGHVSPKTKAFIRGIADTITRGMPNVDFGVYAGYVDPELENAQQRYWGSNLKRLEEIKRVVDPEDLFHNPQSVRPATARIAVNDPMSDGEL